MVGVAAGIVVGQQRKGVKSRIETLESQLLNLESRINALDERSSLAGGVSTAAGGTVARVGFGIRAGRSFHRGSVTCAGRH